VNCRSSDKNHGRRRRIVGAECLETGFSKKLQGTSERKEQKDRQKN